MFEHGLPVLLALAVLAAGCLLLAWRWLDEVRVAAKDHRGAQPFLRGRFRLPFSRDILRGRLFILSAQASKDGDEEAAQFLETAGCALYPSQEWRLQAMTCAGRRDAISTDLREVDRVELERRNRAESSRLLRAMREMSDMSPSAAQAARALRSFGDACRAAAASDAPAFRDGKLVGYLLGVERDQEGAVIEFTTGARFRRGKTWLTIATDEMLAELPAHAFRRVLAALLVLGWLLTPSVRAADFPTYPASQLSQYQHRALDLKPGELVCAFGFVESVRREEDKDYHVWVCSDPATQHWTMTQRRGSCVLGEIVPSHPLLLPAKGLYVKMCGRWIEEDLEHKWTELHPVTGWCSPAGSCEVKP